jgi:hypothetical protein
MSTSDFPSSPGSSTAQDNFNDNFNKTAQTANTIATGAIVAIVVCSVLALASLGVFVWWFRRWSKRRREREAALDSSTQYYGSPAAAAAPPPQPNGIGAGNATTYPPQSPAPEMAGHTSRWEAPGHHHYQQQLQQQQQQQQQQYHSGVSSTSGSTAVESDGHPRYEMDGAAGRGPGTGGDTRKGDQYV